MFNKIMHKVIYLPESSWEYDFLGDSPNPWQVKAVANSRFMTEEEVSIQPNPGENRLQFSGTAVGSIIELYIVYSMQWFIRKNFLNQEDFCKIFLKIFRILQICLIFLNKYAKFF